LRTFSDVTRTIAFEYVQLPFVFSPNLSISFQFDSLIVFLSSIPITIITIIIVSVVDILFRVFIDLFGLVFTRLSHFASSFCVFLSLLRALQFLLLHCLRPHLTLILSQSASFGFLTKRLD
jgi:hypothetical protein